MTARWRAREASGERSVSAHGRGAEAAADDGQDPDGTASTAPDITKGLLRRRDFAIYWWSGIVSSPGNWVHNVSASVLMLTMTGSPFLVGVVNFAIFIPTLLFSLPAGSLGDRFDRRAVVAIAQAATAAVAAGLAVLSATGHLTPTLLVVFCFLIGTGNAMGKPALVSMIPLIVPKGAVARATALNVMQFQFGQIVGPGLASVVLVLATPTWAFAMNAVSCLAPIIAMRLIRLERATPAALTEQPAPVAAAEQPADDRRRSRHRQPGASARSESAVVAGLRFVRRHPLMPGILLAVVLNNGAVEALRTLAPTIADGLGNPEAAGVVIMGYSVGALVGLVSFSQIEKFLPQRWMLVTAFGLQAVGVCAVALAPNLPLTVLGAAPIGLGFSLTTPMLSAALQVLSPDDYRSRVMSVFSMAHLGMRPVFSLAAGALATLLSASWALAVFAVVAAGAGVFTRRRRVAEVET